MTISNRIGRTYRLRLAAGLAGAALLLAGCAIAPMAPTASLDAAKVAIQAAEKADANHYAAAELDQSRQKLMLADKAVVAEDMIMAERLAQESTVTAKLAEARTETAKAKAINEEMRRASKALYEEMQRAGDQQ